VYIQSDPECSSWEANVTPPNSRRPWREWKAEDPLFQLVVASVKDYAIFMIDRSGRVETWNAGASLLKGYQPEEIIGKNHSIFYTPEDRAHGKPHALLETASAQGRVEDEGWRVRKDGSRFWADVVITPIRDSAGELEGFVKVTRDLTARRRDEDRLRRSEASLQATLYSIGDGVLATDEQARVTRVNPVAARLTGWPEREAVGRPIGEVFQIINEKTRAPAVGPVGRVLAEGLVVGLANHTVLVARDGKERPIADSGAPILDAEGKAAGAVLVFRDVTEERRAEEALRESEERLRLMIASVKDYAIFMLDPAGRVASWNSGAELIKGYRPEEIVGKNISIFYTPEDRARGKSRALLETAKAEGRAEDEGWRVRKDGSRFWADVVITPITDSSGEARGFVKVTRDLTIRKRDEDRLRRSEQGLQATLYGIGDGVLATDERARVTRVNPVAARLTGWSEKEAVGRAIGEVFHIINEETRAPAVNPVARVLAEGVVVGLANHTALISRDGKECPIADSGAPIMDAEGKPGGAVLVFRDVSQERRAEDALRQSEERLRSMIASVKDYAIYMLDPAGQVTSWNPGAELIKGYRADEIIGQHFSRFFTAEDVEKGRPARELEIARTQGRFEEEGWRVRKDGTRFWANVVVTPIGDASNGPVGFVKITRDLTERRQAEDERVRLAQAREAVRLRDEFLSIASHELKTPLTALQLQLRSIRVQVGTGGNGLAGRVERAMRVGERMARLVETLLDVSRIATGQLTLTFESFNLVEVAREIIERLRESAAQAECTVSLDAHGSVEGQWDRLRVEQILTNLLSNAIKYAPGTPIEVSVTQLEDTAVLEVRDKGGGIAAEELSRIFERFERANPTPDEGGMGLGLYVAREIVEAHGGTIGAHNLPGGGAGFTVRLPLESRPPAS
jgi:PAS domain S-box-containing protein